MDLVLSSLSFVLCAMRVGTGPKLRTKHNVRSAKYKVSAASHRLDQLAMAHSPDPTLLNLLDCHGGKGRVPSAPVI